jgi:hypothetical protein
MSAALPIPKAKRKSRMEVAIVLVPSGKTPPTVNSVVPAMTCVPIMAGSKSARDVPIKIRA